MLLPEKHITLADSLLGLGAFLLEELSRPRTVDQLFHATQAARATRSLPAYHDFDSVMLALTFLYAIGAVEATPDGGVAKCAS